jgi:hypothetical protein
LTDGSDVAIECLYRGIEREMRVKKLGERCLCQNWLGGIDGPAGAGGVLFDRVLENERLLVPQD